MYFVPMYLYPYYPPAPYRGMPFYQTSPDGFETAGQHTQNREWPEVDMGAQVKEYSEAEMNAQMTGYQGAEMNPQVMGHSEAEMNAQETGQAGADMNEQNWDHSNAYMPMPAAGRQFMDYGSRPYVVNINEAARRNNTFRTAIWTGNYLQVVLMSIQPGDDIGLEVHPNTDQFLRIEAGEGVTRMGDSEYNLDFEEPISRGSAIMVPAGKWHNIINTGNQPLKLYTIYAPPEHPYGTVHGTKEDAMAAEGNY